jgi:hypothetical protein
MSISTLTSTILDKMSEIGKWQYKFLLIIFPLQLSLRGRHNFLNMGRYSELNEWTYRKNYGDEFDFMTFNGHLIKEYCSEELVVAFDPSYIGKSGKKTPGVGYFWSGCASKNKWGLDLGGFAAVDIHNNTAMHLIADQTLCTDEHASLLEYYTALVCRRSEEILKVSKYLAVDAYFSRFPFVDRVCGNGLEIVSRLRNDALLLYPYVGPHPKRRGRKTKYKGQFSPTDLDPAYFSCCLEEPAQDGKRRFRIYEATLYSKSLKKMMRIAVKQEYDTEGAIHSYKIYCSTDIKLSGTDVYIYYTKRYQIEFLFRDAKQFTGLEHCQSRSESRLHFHFNTALTTVSLAKARYHLSMPIEQRTPFSMNDITTQHSNEMMVDLIFSECGIDPHNPIIIPIKRKLLDFGKIRA